MKRFKIFLLLVACLALIVIGCAKPAPAPTPAPTPTPPAPPEVIKARYSGWAPPPSLVGQIEMHFFDLLKEKAGDRLEVEVFQGGTLYKYEEVLLPLKTGAVEIISLTNFTLYEWVPDFRTTILTGAWDVDELRAYQHSSDFESTWDKLLEVSNSIPFAFHPAGTFYLWSSKPLSTVADFNGLRVESGNFEMIDIIKALGGSGGAVPVYDIYTALQQGMYDAAIGTPSIVLGFGWAEFVKYVGTHAWAPNANFILVNKDFWDSLPRDVQDAFKEAAEETTEWSLTFAPQAEEQQLKVLEEKWGIEYFTIEDWEKVVETAQTQVWPEIRGEVGAELFDTAMKYAGLAD